MEFDKVVRARRMVRNFRNEPVARDVVDDLLELATYAPSAGNTWGSHFVVLEGPQTARYWDLTLAPGRREDFPWPGLLHAPVLVLPCADSSAYVERYGEPDKRSSGLGESSDVWGVPYWQIDTAMATMTLLHAAVDRGLGALFFGIFDHERAVCEALAIPSSVRPIGTVALGWPARAQRRSRSAQRGRPPLDHVVHRGRW